MTFHIQDILSAIEANGGLARSSHYEVRIPRAGSSGMSSQDLSYFADTAQLPGMSFQTADTLYRGHGIMERRPYMQNYVDAEIGFMMDANGGAHEYFTDWINKVSKQDPDDDDGFMYEYPDEYVSDMEIEQFNPAGDSIKTWKLLRAWPLTITPVSVGWATQNEIARFTVNFAYNSWKIEE